MLLSDMIDLLSGRILGGEQAAPLAQRWRQPSSRPTRLCWAPAIAILAPARLRRGQREVQVTAELAGGRVVGEEMGRG